MKIFKAWHKKAFDIFDIYLTHSRFAVTYIDVTIKLGYA